ncbi:MAG: ferritin-like domain-containing protein [Endomicrobia bacterium]|nr:ferritin-like domain-containing protein [Endomicrobiia bacterium]
MEKKELLKKLQEALEFEYTDIFLYNNEAELFKKKIIDGDKIAKLYKNFALDEITHADIISKQIINIKGTPVWEYKNIPVSKSIRESLRSHLDREVSAYRNYTYLIEQVEDRELKVLLKGIRENENEHIKQITDFLKRLKI